MSNLGCSTRLLVTILLVVVILFVIGLVGGAIGRGLGLPSISFLDVPMLEIHSFFKGDVLFTAGPLPITNTLIASWITMVVVVLLAFVATRKMRVIPRRLQSIFEIAMETLLNFIESVAGHKNGRRFFPVIATIFIFVIFNAYLALLPIYGPAIYSEDSEAAETPVAGTIVELADADKVEEGEIIARIDTGTEIVDVVAPMSGQVQLVEVHVGDEVREIEVGDTVSVDEEIASVVTKPPLIRSASTDINMTLALAVMAVFFVEFWGLTGKGFRTYISEYINVGELFRAGRLFVKGKITDALMATITGVINAVIGGLEAISHMTRMISFAFRLFGNMTAGEILLLSATFLVPWMMAIPFYGLELLIGFIQALIFGGLTLVFASIAVAHESAEEH
jgi:F0F1-type ATP synthase membrane subunit a